MPQQLYKLNMWSIINSLNKAPVSQLVSQSVTYTKKQENSWHKVFQLINFIVVVQKTSSYIINNSLWQIFNQNSN